VLEEKYPKQTAKRLGEDGETTFSGELCFYLQVAGRSIPIISMFSTEKQQEKDLVLENYYHFA